MYKILLWGTGQYYNEYLNIVKFYEARGDYSIVAVTSNEDYRELDSFPFVKKEELKNIDFEYCLMAVKNYLPVMAETLSIGIDRDKLIPIKVLSMPYFNFAKYVKIKKDPPTIISSTCWAGGVYHRMGLQFCSPTINMWCSEEDFIKLASDTKKYMYAPMTFDGCEWEPYMKKYVPVGKILDIRLICNHYLTFEDAYECWGRRRQRINFDKMIFAFCSKNPSAIRAFNELPLTRKITFVPFPTKEADTVYIKWNKETGISFGERCFHTADGRSNELDLFSLLNGSEDFIRAKY